MARSANWTESAKNRFVIREILVTQLRLPPELISAATQLLAASLRAEVSRAERSVRLNDRYAHARAQAKEMEVIDGAIRKVDQRTIEFVENAMLADHLSRAKSG